MQKLKILREKLKAIDANPNTAPLSKIKVLNELAWTLRSIDLPQVYELSTRAKNLLEDNPHLHEQAKCYTILSEALWLKSEYKDAIAIGTAALKMVKQEALNYLYPYVYAALGNTFWSIGDYAKAYENFHLQLQTAQQLDSKKDEASAYNNIAIVHASLNEYADANKVLQKALDLSKETEDERGQALALNNLAMSLYCTKDYKPALPNALKALELVQKAGQKRLEVSILDTIGLLHLELTNPVQALQYFQQVNKISKDIGAKETEARSLLNMGLAQDRLSQIDKALSSLHNALELLEEIDQKQELSECHLLLSDIYERQQDLVKALFHHKQYHKVYEQVFNNNTSERINHLQIIYDTETAKRESEIHRLKTVELQAALDKVELLSGLLPICANCKKIRDDDGNWHDITLYIRDHSEADFSHGICPECLMAEYPEIIDSDY